MEQPKPEAIGPLLLTEIRHVIETVDKLNYGLYGDNNPNGHRGDIPGIIAQCKETNGTVRAHDRDIATLKSQMEDRTEKPIETAKSSKLSKGKNVTATISILFLLFQAVGNMAGWW